MPYSHQNDQIKNQVWRSLGQDRGQKLFPDAKMDKIFEKNSIFYVKYGIPKILISIFQFFSRF